MEKIHCHTCTCHETLQAFIDLALIPTPGSKVTTLQAWLRYAEWSRTRSDTKTPGYSPNQFTRALRLLGVRIELQGGKGNHLIDYTLIPPFDYD